MSSLVSIIMPAYNSSKFIGDSIQSVLAQTYSFWELIIVDDGSTDNTKEIVDTFIKLDKRIKYFWQLNGKQGRARNKGIEYSTGDYLAFLDSDDLWENDKLSFQINLINEMKVDLVFGNCYLFDDHNRLGVTNIQKNIYFGELGIKAFIQNNQVSILTVLCKRDIVVNVKGFSEKLDIQNAEDYHLWLRLMLSGYTFYSDDRVIAGYRQHSGSITNEDKTASLQVINALLDVSVYNLKWQSFIYDCISKKLKRYLYHHKLNTQEKVLLVLNQIYQVKNGLLPLRFLLILRNVIGERLFRKLLIGYI
ncbi:hypothetical protein AAE02nite_08870 [Adhaeribacter aerolatus]|uniref:Glycosyltransferase 2-like domain-containing protein n=1 Tax=Adhaeribacter aerolatus TaxID=670289 RepID=A0A512AU64_9BACT|nr:glycosyltransferase [Adhaeribacter aerolatus]GEO03223.1 hypothetical protein AAE02nite_08870 [Adhaeribacter aerolatus]